jgi:hypothetical protein
VPEFTPDPKASEVVVPEGVPAGAGRACRRVVRKLASDAGTFSAKCWSLWQRLRPWVR